ncbi:MAG TPA: sigma-E factor negative regulatory protein [Steroidobacteraceae bacterium]
MSNYLRNQLSAFIDGELPRHEIELLFKRLDGNAELRATLARYTVIGESLRTRPAEGPSRAFAERVRVAVQADGPLDGETAARIRWNWFKPVAGFAVAATVATAALFGLQRLQDPALDQAPQLAANGETASVVIGEPTITAQPSYTVPAPATSTALVSATRLTNYVVAHSEYSSPLGRRYVLSGIVAEDPAPLAAREETQTPSAASTDQSREQK